MSIGIGGTAVDSDRVPWTCGTERAVGPAVIQDCILVQFFGAEFAEVFRVVNVREQQEKGEQEDLQEHDSVLRSLYPRSNSNGNHTPVAVQPSNLRSAD